MTHTKLFIYGSLKKDMPNHRFLKGSQFSHTMYLKGYKLLNLIETGTVLIPAMVQSHVEHKVQGEVWLVPDKYMPAILNLEAGYDIIEVAKEPDTGDSIWAFVILPSTPMHTYVKDCPELPNVAGYFNYVNK
jgi:gamma-glutamylcyclotransferase (GGCT)/AIG2-like uncharacterized protein YtfP